MNRQIILTIGIATLWLAVLGGLAIPAQDRDTVNVPGGLAFSEFRGYEAWQREQRRSRWTCGRLSGSNESG